MGVAPITWEREVAPGARGVAPATNGPSVAASLGGGPALRPSGHIPDVRLESTMPILESFKRAKWSTDGTKAVAEAEADSAQILNEEWQDGDGVKHPPLTSLQGEEALHAHEVWAKEMNRRMDERNKDQPLWFKTWVNTQTSELARSVTANLQARAMSNAAGSGVRTAKEAHGVASAARTDGEVLSSRMTAERSADDAESFGTRDDGTQKGDWGWLGPQAYKIDDTAALETECAFVAEIDGKETLIPALVPGLTEDQIQQALGAKNHNERVEREEIDEEPVEYPDDVRQAAIAHAKARMAEGKSVWGPSRAEVERRTAVDRYVQWQREGRARMRQELMLQSYGRMDFRAADRQAREFYDREMQGVVERICETGDFDRAREYVSRGADLGFNDLQIKAGLKWVDAQETKAQENAVSELSNLALEAETMGRIDDMSSISGRMLSAAAGMKEGSRPRALLVRERARLEEACGKRATLEVMQALDNAVQMGTYDPSKASGDDADPMAWGWFPESRHGKAFAKAKEAFDAAWTKNAMKGFAQRRDANVLALRGDMIRYAAEGRPQAFYNELVKAVMEKRIAGRDFTRLSKEFSDGWMKGFKDDPAQLPRRAAVARSLLSCVERTFGKNALAFTGAIARDENGDVALDREGRIAFDKKMTPGDVGYRMKNDERPFAFYGGVILRPGLVRQTISAADMKRMLDIALDMSLKDGMTVWNDPVTGEPIADGKGHVVNAVADFNAWLERLKDEKNVRDAASELAARAAYESGVGDAFLRMQSGRTDAMRRSSPWEVARPDSSDGAED